MCKTKSEDTHSRRDLSCSATVANEASGLTFPEKVSDNQSLPNTSSSSMGLSAFF